MRHGCKASQPQLQLEREDRFQEAPWQGRDKLHVAVAGSSGIESWPYDEHAISSGKERAV
jgi:hypothetical protein